MRPMSQVNAFRGIWILAVVSAAGLWAAPVHAQPVDPVAYRAAKDAATTTFFDRQKSTKVRLQAARGLRYPEEATFARLLRVGADKAEEDVIRAEALKHHSYDERYLDVVLKILDDPRDGGPLLDGALVADLGRRTNFRLPVELRQRIQRTLRALLDDPRDPVRLAAYRVLVSSHDAVATERVAEALRRGPGSPVPVPLAEAIDLLDLDGPAKHIAALRPYLGSADPLVQGRAAHALVVDPESRPRIAALARDSKTPIDVRLHCLRGLAREDAGFAEYAIPLVSNTRESPEVRLAAMKAFAGRMNYTAVPAAVQVRFAVAVEKVAAELSIESAGARQAQDEARRLHGYLKKAFPEIKKHYALP